MESISKYKAPEWPKDAKIGIQFVCVPMDLDDEQWYHYSRAVQLARQKGLAESDDFLRQHIDGIKLVGGVQYVWNIRQAFGPTFQTSFHFSGFITYSLLYWLKYGPSYSAGPLGLIQENPR